MVKQDARPVIVIGVYHLTNVSDISSKNGQTRSHRFQNHIRKAFAMAGKYQNVGFGEMGMQFVTTFSAGKEDLLAQSICSNSVLNQATIFISYIANFPFIANVSNVEIRAKNLAIAAAAAENEEGVKEIKKKETVTATFTLSTYFVKEDERLEELVL